MYIILISRYTHACACVHICTRAHTHARKHIREKDTHFKYTHTNTGMK